MKKLLLITTWLIASITAFAQTGESLATAIDLQEGTNEITYDSDGSHTAYFRFIATGEKGNLLVLKRDGYNPSFQVSKDGTYATSLSPLVTDNGATYTLSVNPKDTVFVAASIYQGASISFNANISDFDASAGQSCANPIFVQTDQPMFVPSFSVNYSAASSYLSYTADADGVMEVATSSYMSNVTLNDGCGGETLTAPSFTYDPATYGYKGKFNVETGHTYILAVGLYSPAMLTFTMTHPTEGFSCDMPFAATPNADASLPAAAGKYWFQVMPDATGYMTIDADESLAGGAINVYDRCNAYSALYTVNGQFAARFPVTAGTPVMIAIERSNEASAPTTFHIAQESAQAGDTFENPIAMTGTTATLPKYNGTYYYSFTTADGAAQMLEVTTPAGKVVNGNTSVSLYAQSSPYNQLGYGQTGLKAEVSGNTTYILRWNAAEGNNTFPFTIALEAIKAGDVANNPIVATLGDNDLDASSVKYYSYTPTKNCWLCIDAEPNITVSFPADAREYSYYEVDKQGTISRMRVTKDATYLIKMEGATDNTIFTLSERDFQQGESADNPIPVEAGATTLPTRVLNDWYVYTATKEGKLTISSDMAFEYSSDYSRQSKVVMYQNEVTPQNAISINQITGYEGTETMFQGTVIVKEGDKVYVNIVSITPQNGKTLSFELADLEPGQSASKPIVIEENECDMTLPYSSRQTPTWYQFTMTEGEMSMQSVDDSYFDAIVYASDDLSTPLASSTYKYDYDTYTGVYSLNFTSTKPEATTYLICVQGTSYTGANVHFSAPSLMTGIAAATTDGAAFTMNNGIVSGKNVRIYSLDGKQVMMTGGQAQLKVGQPYIINNQKVIVR